MSDQAARALLERMNLREVLVAPIYTALAADLRQMAFADPVKEQAAFMDRRGELVASYGFDGSQVQNKPFAFSNGLAIVPVVGTLINRFGSSWGFLTGYNFIRAQVAAAGVDKDVVGIVYDVHSYGGEAAGCFECANDLPMLANGKPTLAVIDSAAYSGGYAIACVADRVVMTPSGGTGSIGVLRMHVDYSKMLSEEGVKVTLIHSGDHKVDGNPYEPLPKSVQADMQAESDVTYGMFVSHVAKNREMEEKDVRATEARTYQADAALAAGLIDAIETPNLAVQGFFGELSGSTLQLQQEPTMANEQDNKPGADQAAALEQARVTAAAEAKTAERTRITGIQSCEEAKGRESLANHIAMSTDMSVADAKSMLAAASKTEPKAVVVEAKNPLAAAMDATGGGPKVGADAVGGDAEGKSDTDVANALISSFALASGRKLKLVGEK